MVVGNPLIRSTSHIGSIFQASAFGAAASGNDFFRPIQTLSYILDYHLFGLDASGFHTMSWLYFLLACCVLFYLLTLLTSDIQTLLSKKSILAIVFLFALHPLNIEVVTYVSGRGDVLFLLFALIALTGAVISGQNKTWGIPLAWIATLLAILSKENAVAMPFVMGLLWLILPQPRWRYWAAVVPAMIGNFAYISYRMMAMGDPNSSPLSTIAFASLGERILTVPYILWTYFKLIFFPYPLHMDYLHVVTDIMNPYLWIGLPILSGVLFFLWKSGKKGLASQPKPSQNTTFNRLYIFLLAWVALGIGPVLQIVPLTATLREHWFSFSLIAAITLIIVSLSPHVEKRPQWQQYMVFGTILMTLIGLTYTRNLDWADPMRLYSHDVTVEPRSFLLHNNIGVLQYRNGNFTEAKQAFQKSVLVTPNDTGYGTALNNLGVIAEQEKNIPEALRYYQRSIMASHYELAYANALRILVSTQQWKIAHTLANEALTRYPYHQDILRYATMSSFQLGYQTEGDTLLKRLKQLYPE